MHVTEAMSIIFSNVEEIIIHLINKNIISKGYEETAEKG